MLFKIYTDGACKNNPGIGGWAAIIVQDDRLLWEISGNNIATTSNRMELTAPIEACKFLLSKQIVCKVEIYTDSKYVHDGALFYLSRWINNDWLSYSKSNIKNQDLWVMIHDLKNCKLLDISWFWVKGHSGHPLNDRAHNLAHAAIERLTNTKILKNNCTL